jgi:predicted glycosyltransferase
MRILFDIGHPAHVHYFKNLIWLLQKRENEITVTARDKEVAHNLLKAYGIDYSNRGEGGKTLVKKLLYFIKGDYEIFKCVEKFRPNLLVSFASPYLAQISKITGIPHIVLDDTEHNSLNHFLYKYFSKTILTPQCFNKDFGKKHIKFNSYMELSYLHPNYFKPIKEIRKILGLGENEKYVVLRFVSWNASHDIGEKGLSYTYKNKLVKQLSKMYRIFISSEGELPKELSKYRLKINSEEFHSVLASAELYIGEGSTTASECSMLGTPNIYVNSLSVGYCTEQEHKYGLTFHYKTEEGVLEKAFELLNNPNLRRIWAKRRLDMLKEKIDVTAFLLWFVEMYPSSFEIVSHSPNFLDNFINPEFENAKSEIV